MKTSFLSIFSMIALAGLFACLSCKKTVTVEKFNSSTPLYALLIGDTSLSLFNRIVQKAGDSVLYHGTDSIAVLMPVNAALLAQGIDTNAIKTMAAGSLDSLVRYHYIPGGPIADTGICKSNQSLLGPALYGYKDTSGTYFNGIYVEKKNLPGSRAVVYKLNTLLKAPASSITQLLSADASLSFFAAAINRAGINLAPSSGWNTVLAPDNNAFIAAGYSSIAAINNADANALAVILKYHVVPVQYFAHRFAGYTTIATLQGSSINLSVTNSITQFKGTNNAAAAIITQADRIAGTNIILQKINAVLKP